MRDDAVTESISHFIGLFALTEEQSRLRLDYEQFKAKQAQEKEKALLEATSRSREAPLDPRDYEPELDFKAPAQAPRPDAPLASAMPVPPPPAAMAVALTPPEQAVVLPQGLASSSMNLHLSLPTPSSMAAVVVQTNALSDNDVVGADPRLGLEARVASEAAMSALEALAQSLTPFHLSLQDIDGEWFGIVDTLVQSAADLAFAVGSLPGAVTEIGETGEMTIHAALGGGALQMSFATGIAAQGVHVDGAPLAELPEWQDFLPDFLAEEEEAEEDSGTPEAEEAPHDFAKDFQDGQPGISAHESGHHIVTGGNELVNETTIQSTWLDAKVFVVGGDYLRFDGISQTNVIVETDSTFAGTLAWGGAGQPGAGATQGYNLASIETLSRAEYDRQKAEEAKKAAAEDGSETPAGDPIAEAAGAEATGEGVDISVSAKSYAGEDGEAAGGTGGGDAVAGADGSADEGETDGPASHAPAVPLFPTSWAVTTISGDLIQINWSEQTNFVSDSDTVSFGFTASATMLATGENFTVNDFNAWELGFQYDLIIVGGNMIDATIIKQMNILLDSDRFEVEVPAEAPGGTIAAEGAARSEGQQADHAGGTVAMPLAGTGTTAPPVPSEATSIASKAGTMPAKSTAEAGAAGENGVPTVSQMTGMPAQPVTAAHAVSSDGMQAAAGFGPSGAMAEATAPASGPEGMAGPLPLHQGTASPVAQLSSEPVQAKTAETPIKPSSQDAPDASPSAVPVGGKAASPSADVGAQDSSAQDPLGPSGAKASLADNMLVNQARITTVGEDLQAEMDEAYSDMLQSFQNKQQAVSQDVLTKSDFADTPTLRVLYIENDFKTLNVVQQTNVLGDDDSLQLEIDEFAAGLQDSMQVTMGSNALANLASVKDSGMDSKIAAQGQTYSDAVLHQAEFVMPDMPDMPDMSGMKAQLATEAVAFLSDDLVADPSPDAFKADMFAQMDAAMPSADVMQSMLA